MKNTLIVLFVLFAINASGQSLFPTKFDNCHAGKFYVENNTLYTKCDPTAYLNEVISSIDPETLSTIEGKVTLQVIINKQGNPCCQSMKSELNESGKKVDFKTIIDNIDLWETPLRNNEAITASAILKIIFTKKQVKLQRMGFNMKTGLVVLDQATLNK